MNYILEVFHVKHSVFESFDYQDFSKEDIYDMLVELQEHTIKEKESHIQTAKALLVAKKNEKSLSIEIELLKEKNEKLNILFERVKVNKRKMADFAQRQTEDD